jgi:HD superfamily phosphohydrolase
MEFIIRDPVHTDIILNKETDNLLLDLLNTPELQRLRRIKQLGNTESVLPGATHSRFGHSLGVMYVARELMHHLFQTGAITAREHTRYLELVSLAALLHDAGHGPYSHAFERVSRIAHESVTYQIIKGGTAVNRLLRKRHPDLPGQIIRILRGQHPVPWLCNMISSQLDADRMDYLVRDSMMCGVRMGLYDIRRVISSLTVHQGQLVAKEKGLAAVEAYLLARYYMYWQVYHHPAIRVLDFILLNCLRRAQALQRERKLGPVPPAWEFLLSPQKFSLASFLTLDDTDVIHQFKSWSGHGDPILSDLSRRFVERRLLKRIRQDLGAQAKKLPALVRELGFDPKYYLIKDRSEQSMYDASFAALSRRRRRGGDQSIYVLIDGRSVELSECSDIFSKITSKKEKTSYYVPPEVRDRL